MYKLTVPSKGGRGGARRSRARQSSIALLGRLRRLETLVLTMLSPQDVRHVTDSDVKAMLQAIGDAHRGYISGEEVQVPHVGSTDRETP